MVIRDVVVIGSGPAAIACCSELVSQGMKPMVIDASDIQDFDLDDYNSIKAKNLKNYGQDFQPYAQPKIARIIYDKQLSVRQSFSLGGFSRAWGATLDLDLQVFESEVIAKVKSLLGWNNYKDLNVNVDDKVNRFITRINEKKSNFKASRAKLAINSIGDNSCKHSLLCFDKCPNNAIWFAGNSLTTLINDEQIEYKNNLILMRLESEDNKVNLYFANGETISSKKVFLALGPIGSSAVLIRSGFRENFSLNDTHTVQSALLSFRRIKENKQQNALSKIWIKGSNSEGKFYIQMHQRSELHLGRLLDNLPKILKFMWIAKILSRFVYPILIYFNQGISGQIIVKNTTSGISVVPVLNEANKKSINVCLREIKKSFFSLGLYLPISQTKLGQPGDGYHCGGSLEIDEHINRNGELIGLPNIFVVDSSVLQDLPLGSITPTIMANSITITKLAIGRQGL